MSTKTTLFISGKLSWAKILGEPVPNYSKDGREWTFELEPDEKGLQALIKNDLTDRIKGKGYNVGTKGQHSEKTPFIQLKKPEFNREGEPNTRLRIYDNEDQAWDPMLNSQGVPTNLIGNGSAADVKLDVRDYGPGKKKGVYPSAIRVTDHIEYQSSEFGAMDDAGDEPAPRAKSPKKDTFKQDFGLDDEVPV